MAAALRLLSFSMASAFSPFDDVGSIPRSSFSAPSKPSLTPPRSLPATSRKKAAWRCESRSSNSHERVPKQFREENLEDGLMENYKSLYGLTASQLALFMTVDNPVTRQGQKVTEESISSARSYLENSEIYNVTGMKKGQPKYSMMATRAHGGGSGRPTSPPPDLPSMILDGRIVYLGMPISPAVTELIVAEFMWLDFDDSTKPIYLYINSSGTENEKRESIAFETDAYAIADMINMCKAPVYTLNLGMAHGQAAMLLSLGVKGHRALQRNSSTKLYLPKVHSSSGPVSDMWIKAKELDTNTEYLLEFLEQGIGKPRGEIAKDIEFPRHFLAQEAIDYGIADRILEKQDAAYDRSNYEDRVSQSSASWAAQSESDPRASPYGYR